MDIKQLIITYKEQILPELYKWVETFNPENIIYNKWNIEQEEELYISYKFVADLVKRFDENQCSDKDYADIFFHIEQINYDEIIIKL